ncbi:site-specific integrase [Paludisphaera sp.]|uniref:tyrosine-type recombinase/integrase n=1 Tax=Paludisphaera sp. TaxID=2017432 RepID=UPI00301B7596
MPRPDPKYRHYKPKNLGMVVIRGKAFYLGRYDSPESWEKYHRLLADLHSGSSSVPIGPDLREPVGDFLVEDLVLAYWERRVLSYYLKDGAPTSERDNIRQALRFLRRLHGHTPAVAFGPLALKAVRQSMIDAGRCRKLINKDVHRIRAMFRWAVGEELFPGPALQALLAVEALAKGRTPARDHPPIAPVDEQVVLATLPHLSPQVAAMVRLQLLTAARPGEVASLRPRDVDRSDPRCWIYRPESHKTEHHGRERIVVIGPRAREVLTPWLDRRPDEYCFSPAEAVAGRLARERPAGRAARPEPGGRYSKDSYRTAIRRACLRAGVAVWTPHQLRHSRATAIRREYDLEAAQIVLGHSKPETTLIYAERDLGRAMDVMARIG